MTSSFKVIWTSKAVQSKIAMERFLSRTWGKEVLEVFYDLIDERIHRLKENPLLGKSIGYKEYRKLVIHKNVSIFYVVESSTVFILLIWDNRQDPKELEKILNLK